MNENKEDAAYNAVQAKSQNIFADLSKLRIPLGLNLGSGVELLSKVPVRKPLKQEFIRVNPAEDMMLPTVIYEDTHERETFLVSPDMMGFLADQLKPAVLVVAVNRQNVTFVWPVKVANDAASKNDWQETALQGCELAKKRWIRLSVDMSLGAYRLFEAQGELSEPTWMTKPLNQLLEVAFRDKVISSEDHPVVKRLRGLV